MTCRLSVPFNRNDVLTYVRYVHAYAEFLFRWELHHKRLELLKVVDPHAEADVVAHRIGSSIPRPASGPILILLLLI